MEHGVLLLVITGVFAAFLFQRGVLDAIIEALNNFRGGPPTPMHPSPSNDGALLRRRAKKPRSKYPAPRLRSILFTNK